MTCKHNWRFKFSNELYEFYYCSKCLAEAQQNSDTLSYNISNAEREDEVK